MTLRYLSEFYSHRALQPGLPGAESLVGLPLERQLQLHLLRGDRAFVSGSYAEALTDYRAAWELLPRLVDPLFPADADGIAETALLDVDLIVPLVSAAVQILRLRQTAGPDVPIVAAADPPDALRRMAGGLGRDPRPGEQAYATALAHLRAGELDIARPAIASTLWRARRDAAALADARNLAGALAIIDGDVASGRAQFGLAAELYEAGGRPDGAAAMRYNRGVAAALTGDFQEALALLSTAASAPFLGAAWQLSRSTLPGVASFSLLIEPPGLPLVARGSDGQWVKISASRQPAQSGLRLVHDGAPVWIDLEDGRDAALVARLLKPRVQATTLSALDANLGSLPSFVAHLAHVGGWVLPLSLGDAYSALGDHDRAEPYFLKARGYRFLNPTIERPALWRRLAETYLERGKRLLADGRPDAARQQFRHIVPWDGRDESAHGAPLYAGAFSAYRNLARTFSLTPNPVAFDALDYGSRIVLLEAGALLHRFEHGIAAFPLPGHPLATVTGREQARHVEAHPRQGFLVGQDVASAASGEDLGRDALDRLARAREAALAQVEWKRHDADARQSMLEQRAEAAATRLAAAHQVSRGLEGAGSRAAKLVQVRNWWKDAGGPTSAAPGQGAVVTWLSISRGDGRPTMPTIRTQATRGQELATLRGQIMWLERAQADIDADLTTTRRLVEDAALERALARLRLDQSRAQARYFDVRACILEQSGSARRALRTLGERAPVGAAGHETPSDLIAGDERPLPLRASISLAERLPQQFFQQLQSTGRLEFETIAADVDRLAPGACLASVRRIAVEIDAPSAATPIRGVLTNTGISAIRDRRGALRTRAHRPESMDVSGGWGLVETESARSSSGGQERFAGIPVIGSWVLELPQAGRGFDPRAVVDVRLTIDFDAYAGPHQIESARAHGTWPDVHEHALGFGMRTRYPGNFALLRSTGMVSFAIDPEAIPAGQTDPRVLDTYLVLDAAGHLLPKGLVVTIAKGSDATPIDQLVDDDGMIGIKGADSRVNALRGRHLIDTWTVRIDRQRNQAAFSDGFSWKDIRDVYFLADYAYTPLVSVAASNPPRASRWRREIRTTPAIHRL